MKGDVVLSIYGVKHVDSGQRGSFALCGVRIALAVRTPKKIVSCPTCARIAAAVPA